MKKLFSAILIFVFFASIAQDVAAQSSYDDNDAITVALLGHFNTSGAYDIDMTEWFRRSVESVAQQFGGNVDMAPAPQNIYLLMYTQVKAKPKKAALKKTLDKNKGLSKEEIQALLSGKSIRNIPYAPGQYGLPESLKDFQKSETQVALRKSDEELQREFNLEKELAEFASELESEVVATEIFANGDTADSGFDLLYDLNIVNIILFGEPYTLFATGSGPGAPAGARERQIGRAPGEAERGEERAPGGAPGPGVQRPEGEGVDAAGREGAGEGEAGRGGASVFNPESCFVDQSLQKAVSDFEERLGEEQRAAAAAGLGGIAGRQGQAGRGGEEQGAGGVGGSGGQQSGQQAAGEEAELQPATAKNWQRQLYCEDQFCLKVELKVKTEHARPPTANCVACHVEKINDAYLKTVRRNLVPSKATGNLLEVPKCKAGISLPDFLNFNFVIIPSLIITPPNDDLITKSDFLKELSAFWDKYSPFPKPKKTVGGSGNKVEKEVPDIIAQAEKRALANTAEKTSVDQVTADINAEVAAKRREAVEVMREYKTLSRAENYSDYSRTLISEMNTMTAYFENFQKMFGDMQTPCKRLLDKSICE